MDAHSKIGFYMRNKKVAIKPLLLQDATNVMVTNGIDFEYLCRGMAGRPTRTLIEFIAQTICKDTAPKMGK